MLEEETKIVKVANNAILLLASRASGLLVVGLCGWILNTTMDIKINNAAILAKLEGQDQRIKNLEDWRNYFVGDAHAANKDGR